MNRTLVSFTLLALTSATCLAQESSTTNLVEQETSLSTTAITKPATLRQSTLLQHGINSIVNIVVLVATLVYLAPLTETYMKMNKDWIGLGAIFLYAMILTTVCSYFIFIHFATKFTSANDQVTLTQCVIDSTIKALIATCFTFIVCKNTNQDFNMHPSITAICFLTLVISTPISYYGFPYYRLRPKGLQAKQSQAQLT